MSCREQNLWEKSPSRLTCATQQVHLRGRGSRRKGRGFRNSSRLYLVFSSPPLSLASQTRAMWPLYWHREWVTLNASGPLFPERNIPCISPSSNLSPQPEAFMKLLSPGHPWLATGDNSGTITMPSIPSRGYPALRAVDAVGNGRSCKGLGKTWKRDGI